MLSDEEKKAIERIEDFLTTNIIVSISSDETANSEELKAFISKNEYLSIEFISAMFLKQSKEIEELKEDNKRVKFLYDDACKCLLNSVDKDKIKARIEELEGFLYKGNIKDDFLMIRIKAKIQALQSLLEKE
jgi:hypothetical protein